MNRRRSWIVLAIVVAVTLAVLGADRLVELPRSEPATVAPVTGEAVSGAYTCAAGDGRDGSRLDLVAAHPGEVGDDPAVVDLDVFGDGEVRSGRQPQVFPGAHVLATPTGRADVATFTHWSGGPVAVTREWRLLDVQDTPNGTLAGPCHARLSDRWVVPGLSTDGGNEAWIRAVNPFPTDATIAVGFLTPQGPQEPLALQNLTVPAHGSFELTVNDSMPEQADLTAVVRVLSGRAVAEGYLLTRSAIGGVDGVSLLESTTGPSEGWTVPWVSGRDGDASWLWVANLGERPAPVEITLHTPDGGAPPVGLSDVTVAPGQVRRIDLRGTFPEGVTAAAASVRSDGAPVHVSGAVRRSADDPARTGFSIQRGVPDADATWVVSGGPTAGRNERIEVVNPGSEAVGFSVVLFNGSTVVRPGEFVDLEIGPGQTRSLPLADVLGDVAGWSARIVADGEIVAARIGAGGEGGLHLLAHAGVPSAAWAPGNAPLPVTAAPGVVQRLETVGGIRAPDPLRPSEDESEPAPDPDQPNSD
ncbi:MAG TPA: DUF5719 family protein [Egicoccus sp.]|nr:DUF5719 family protein [Egicoccus sp.]HSK25157.1 DUF5719 family protein [Egicoccus sp.]